MISSLVTFTSGLFTSVTVVNSGPSGGTAAFTALAGQLRHFVSGATSGVEGDATGNKGADFQFQVNPLATFSAGDILL